MKDKKEYLVIPTLLLIILGLFISPFENNEKEPEQIKQEEKTESNDKENETLTGELMTVHYIDVGKADSIFIELPNNKNMLIDAGESINGPTIKKYIENLGYDTIHYLIATHPDADHIGGMPDIINGFKINNIYMPRTDSTTKTYERLLTTILENGLTVKTARAGVNIIDENNLKIDIIAPNSSNYKNKNDWSAVIKINYGYNSFLFMGDAQSTSEKEILENNFDIKADVLKVGHHGSNTSSSQDFLDKAQAKYAIITVGYKKNYNLPSEAIIERLKNSGMEVYRTDTDGTIIVHTNGVDLTISKEGK